MNLNGAVWVAIAGGVSAVGSAVVALREAARARKRSVTSASSTNASDSTTAATSTASREGRRRPQARRRSSRGARGQKPFDFLMSSAAGEGAEVARALAGTLKERHLNVWLDEDQLRPGDNIPDRMAEGIGQSKYGVVILTPDTFEAGWAKREMEALLKREAQGQIIVVPIKHGVTEKDIAQFAPPLLNKVTLDTATEPLDTIAEKLADLVERPRDDIGQSDSDMAER